MFPTPVAKDDGKSFAGSSWKGQHRGATLTTSVLAAQMWPTPQAHDAAPGNASRVGRYGTEHGGRNLNDWVALWPTPTISGNHNRKGASATSGDGLATAAGGALNPTWVEWLMGLPLGWTDLGR